MKKSFGIIVFTYIINVVTARAAVAQELANLLNLPIRSLAECALENHRAQDLSKLDGLFDEKSKEETEKLLDGFDTFLVCTFEKSKIMQNGKISVENLVHVAEQNNFSTNDKIKQHLDECVEEANSKKDKYKVGYTFAVCFLQHWQMIKLFNSS